MSEFDIFFDEYESKHNCSPEKRECFEAGQQSQQAEIDELQLKLSEDSRVLHNVIDIERKKCEELQKRIDALSKKLNEMAHIFLDDLDDILKRDSHES